MTQSQCFLNIDLSKWANPFRNSNFSHVERILLYEKYLRQTPELLSNLFELTDKTLISMKNVENEWTEIEVLKKLLCEFGFSKQLCVIKRDILTNTCGIIVHQVNCRLKMGAGIALQIKNKWPTVFSSYIGAKTTWLPGMIQIIAVDTQRYKKLFVCNLAGQDDYGNDKNIIYTNYPAVREALQKLQKVAKILDIPVFIPYGMGCGHANGDWETYSQIILKELPSAIICKHD